RRSHDHPPLPVDGAHVDLAQAHVREREALARRHVEFERVPGARDDLAVPDPGQPPVGVRAVVERAGDAPLTQRAALMRAEVWDRVELAADVEDADLAPPDPHDAMRAHGELFRTAHSDLVHATAGPKKRIAFWPMIFRRASASKGRPWKYRGWSKSWCGQSEANIAWFSPSKSS